MFIPPFISTFIILLFLGLLILAAYEDVRDFRIPNAITLAIAALYPVHVALAGGTVDWLFALALAAAVFAAGALFFALGVMGGGDAKLMGSVALWAGPAHLLDFILITSLVGGVIGLVMVTRLRVGFALAVDPEGRRGVRDKVLNRLLPYGVAIAAGGLYVGARLLAGR